MIEIGVDLIFEGNFLILFSSPVFLNSKTNELLRNIVILSFSKNKSLKNNDFSFVSKNLETSELIFLE